MQPRARIFGSVACRSLGARRGVGLHFRPEMLRIGGIEASCDGWLTYRGSHDARSFGALRELHRTPAASCNLHSSAYATLPLSASLRLAATRETRPPFFPATWLRHERRRAVRPTFSAARMARPCVLTAKIVQQRLALLSEGKLQKRDERRFFNLQFFQSGRHGKPQRAGVDLRRRRERSRRQREQLVDTGEELHGGGEQSVIPAARRRRDAVGDFALHHDHRALDVLVQFQNSQHDVGGDVIRQIADYVDGLGLGGPEIVQRSRPAADHRGKLRRNEIRFEDFDIRFGRVAHAQLRRQHAIKLDSDHAFGPRDQHIRENAAARDRSR